MNCEPGNNNKRISYKKEKTSDISTRANKYFRVIAATQRRKGSIRTITFSFFLYLTLVLKGMGGGGVELTQVFLIIFFTKKLSPRPYP